GLFPPLALAPWVRDKKVRGRVSERPKEAVSKTVRRCKAPRGFKSLPFRHVFHITFPPRSAAYSVATEESRSWPSAHDWKSCHPKRVTWVRIPPPPPHAMSEAAGLTRPLRFFVAAGDTFTLKGECRVGRFQDQVALVTGGGQGIGRAISFAFAREGARVVVADLDEEAGNECVDEIQAQGGKARFVPVDVADEAAVQRMM